MHWQVGQRVKLHPATDWWMRGATTGVITLVGHKYVHVCLEVYRAGRVIGKTVRFRKETDLIEGVI